jgi:hypothetical protein
MSTAAMKKTRPTAAAAKGCRNKAERADVEEWWLRRETKITALRDELLSVRGYS